MGCNIHCFAEIKDYRKGHAGKWIRVHSYFTPTNLGQRPLGDKKGNQLFDQRNYSVFGFLADVNNYSECQPISKPKGLPHDISDDVKAEYNRCYEPYSPSWLSATELKRFDYDQRFLDWKTGSETEGQLITYRKHLGEMFFVQLKELGDLVVSENLDGTNDVRIVFWFD